MNTLIFNPQIGAPISHELADVCDGYTERKWAKNRRMRRKVCLFGTSADPPTGNGGHVGIIRAISELQEFDEIRILPVYRHNYSVRLLLFFIWVVLHLK